MFAIRSVFNETVPHKRSSISWETLILEQSTAGVSIFESLPGVIGTIGKSVDSSFASCGELSSGGNLRFKSDGLIDLHFHVLIDILHVWQDSFILFKLMSFELGFDFTLDRDGRSVSNQSSNSECELHLDSFICF
jgi:hypothetical protein